MKPGDIVILKDDPSYPDSKFFYVDSLEHPTLLKWNRGEIGMFVKMLGDESCHVFIPEGHAVVDVQDIKLVEV